VIVRIAEWECRDCLQLPVSGLFSDKGRWAVFVAEGGKAKLVTVRIGRMNDETAQLLEGVSKGK
jgi:HlyD family secretion protein